MILAGQALPQSTLLGAVDVCFKAFYVLDINYPKQCAAAWEFLQQVVFEIEGRESNQVKGEVLFFTTYTLFLAYFMVIYSPRAVSCLQEFFRRYLDPYQRSLHPYSVSLWGMADAASL